MFVGHTNTRTLALPRKQNCNFSHMEFWNLAWKQRQFAMWTRSALDGMSGSTLRHTSYSLAYKHTAWIACKSVMCVQDTANQPCAGSYRSQSIPSIYIVRPIYMEFWFCFHSLIYFNEYVRHVLPLCILQSFALHEINQTTKSTTRKKKVCTAPFLKISFFFFFSLPFNFRSCSLCVNMNGSHVTWHATNHCTKHDVHLQIELKIAEKKKKWNKIYKKIITHSRMRRHSTKTNWRYWHAFFFVCFSRSLLWLECDLFYGCRIEFIGICNELPIARFWHSWCCPKRRISRSGRCAATATSIKSKAAAVKCN